MQLQKLASTLTIAILFIGCTSQLSQEKDRQITTDISQPKISTPLKAAIEELRVLRIKIEGQGGINPKEYGEDLDDLVNIVDKAYGNPKALKAVKSAVEGHKLARKFWQCDRIIGYEELYECRDNVLKKVFAKYPDIAAQAHSAVESQNVSYISAGLDEEAVLQAIWQKTSEDTEVALQVVNPEPNLKQSPS
jgi:hypothetical protein